MTSPLPPLREDVQIITVSGGDFLIVDAKAGTGFDCNSRERLLLELLDGRNDEATLKTRYREQFGQELTTRQLRNFIEQLKENGLFGEWAAVGIPSESASAAPPRKLEAAAPLSDADPGVRLNSFFDALVLLSGFVLHPLVLVAVLGIALVTFLGVVKYWELALADWQHLMLAADFPLVFLILVVKLAFLDLPRSVLVGMTGRSFGGRVYSVGLTWFHGLVPVITCDIKDAYATVSKRGKRALLTVPLAFQVAVASIAILGWLGTRGLSSLSSFFLLLSAPAVFGLVIHANPFLPLSAYQLLSWGFTVPNLWYRSRREVRAWIFFRRASEPLTRRERFWFRAYGLSTYVFTISLTVLVTVLGTWILFNRFGRLGALLAFALMLRWFQGGVRSFLMSFESFRWLIRTGGRWYIRWPLRLVILLALIAVALLPYDHEISGEGRVLPAQQYGARAQITAELIEILVQEGDVVKEGDVLARMTDRDVSTEIERTLARLAEAEATHQLLLSGFLPEEIAVIEREVDRLEIELTFQEGEVLREARLVEAGITSQEMLDQRRRQRDSAIQRLAGEKQKLARARIGARDEELEASQANIERLRSSLAFHRKQERLLSIRTPIAGRVATPYMSERLGQVAEEGELVCVVESEDLLVQLEADEAAATRVQDGMRAELRLWGLDGVPLFGSVVRLSHSAHNGSDQKEDPVRSDRELLIRRPPSAFDDETHIRVYIKLDDVPEGLVPGMTGYGKITIGEERLWQAVSRPIVRFFRTEVWYWLP